MSRVFVERATVEDQPALSELQRACHSHPWTASQVLQELVAPAPGAVLAARVLVGRGRTQLGAACAYRVMLDEMEILDVSVHARFRRHGLARLLLKIAMRRAARAGARSAWLEVRRGNSAALRLYQSLGFTRCGLRRDYYASPLEDAVLLRREGLDPSC